MSISDKDFEIDEAHPYVDENGKSWTWWELRPTMIFLPYPSWVEIKKFVIKVCKKYDDCKGTGISDWERKVDYIDKQLTPNP